MKRTLLLFNIIYFITAGISLNAQGRRPDSAEEIPVLRRQSLDMTIESRVLQNGEVVWSEINQKVSVQGSPVGVQLVGSNIIVVVQFTPYIRAGGSVLAAQSQIWIAENENELTYYTSIETIPFEFGEPIHYLPLGPEHLTPSIEIIVSIDSYSEGGITPENATPRNR